MMVVGFDWYAQRSHSARCEGAVVALYTQADLDNLRGTLAREAEQLGLVFAHLTNVTAPDYGPTRDALTQWEGDWGTWALNPTGMMLGDQYLAGQALIGRAQALEARMAALGAPPPFPVQPPTPSFDPSNLWHDLWNADLTKGIELAAIGWLLFGPLGLVPAILHRRR